MIAIGKKKYIWICGDPPFRVLGVGRGRPKKREPYAEIDIYLERPGRLEKIGTVDDQHRGLGSIQAMLETWRRRGGGPS